MNVLLSTAPAISGRKRLLQEAPPPPSVPHRFPQVLFLLLFLFTTIFLFAGCSSGSPPPSRDILGESESVPGSLPKPADRPLLFADSMEGMTEQDITVIDPLTGNILKTIPNAMRGASMNSWTFTSDDRFAYFQPNSAPWIGKITLSTLEFKRILAPGTGTATAFALTPDEKYLYAAYDNGIIGKLDPVAEEWKDIIFLVERKRPGTWNVQWEGPGSPHTVIMDPSGRYMWVNIEHPVPGSNASLWKIDLTTDEVLKRIDLGKPAGGHGNSVITPDGKYIYVTSLLASTVWVIDAEKDEIVKIFEDGAGNHGAYLHPGGRYVWVVNDGRYPTDKTNTRLNQTIWIIDTRTNERTKIIPMPPRPHWVEFTPDGRYAVAEGNEVNKLVLFDAEKQEIIKTVDVGTNLPPIPDGKIGAWHPRISPDGRLATISVNYADAVQIVNLVEGEVLHTVKVGKRPHQGQLFWPGYPYHTGWSTLRDPR